MTFLVKDGYMQLSSLPVAMFKSVIRVIFINEYVSSWWLKVRLNFELKDKLKLENFVWSTGFEWSWYRSRWRFQGVSPGHHPATAQHQLQLVSSKLYLSLSSDWWSLRSSLVSFLSQVTTDQQLYPSPSSYFVDDHLQLIEFIGKLVGKVIYEVSLLFILSFAETFEQLVRSLFVSQRVWLWTSSLLPFSFAK